MHSVLWIPGLYPGQDAFTPAILHRIASHRKTHTRSILQFLCLFIQASPDSLRMQPGRSAHSIFVRLEKWERSAVLYCMAFLISKYN